MRANEELIDLVLKCAKNIAFWLFWLLFYILFDLELTLVCLLILLNTKIGKS